MTKQFSSPIFPETEFAAPEKPSFLSRFIFTVVGLGILTVIGVASYSASTRYVQKLSEVQPVKSVEIQSVAQSDSSAQDGLEPMVAPRATLSTDETALPPVESPFQTAQPTPPASKTKPSAPPVISPPTNAVSAADSAKIQSADEVVSADGDHQSEAVNPPQQFDTIESSPTISAAPAPTSESPVPVPEP